MVEFQTSSLTGAHLLTAVKCSAYLHLCYFAKTTSAFPASSKKCRSAHCSKELCAAPAVSPLICTVTNLKAFSKILLCVFDLLCPTDSRGLLSFQADPSADNLAITCTKLPHQKRCPLPCVLAPMPFYLHYCEAGTEI